MFAKIPMQKCLIEDVQVYIILDDRGYGITCKFCPLPEPAWCLLMHPTGQGQSTHSYCCVNCAAGWFDISNPSLPAIV